MEWSHNMYQIYTHPNSLNKTQHMFAKYILNFFLFSVIILLFASVYVSCDNFYLFLTSTNACISITKTVINN